MALEQNIMQDLKAAMKAKDADALRAIRAVKAAILNFKTSGTGDVLDEAAEIKLLQKMIKQRQDSLDIYEKQNREDLAANERAEIEVISKYLPEPLSAEDLAALIKEVIEETGASSMKDMGRVMGIASQKAAGRADGKALAAQVKALLTS